MILDADSPPARGGITVRSLLIGFFGVFFTCAYSYYNDWYLGNTFFIGNSFPIGILILMMLVLGGNSLVRWRFEGRHLSFAELAVILTMLWTASAVPTSGLMRYLVPVAASPIQQQLHNPGWAVVMPYIPRELMVSMDPSSPEISGVFNGRNYIRTSDWLPPHLSGFYNGSSSAGTFASLLYRVEIAFHFLLKGIPWKSWLPVLMRWGAYFVMIYAALLGWSFLLRRQWVHHEHLSFPLSQVMLTVLEEPERGRVFNSFFRNPYTWAGAILLMVVHVLHGLHAYYPNIPEIPLRYNARPLFSNDPWWHAPWCLQQGPIQPGVACVAFLVPAEVTFSMWFFMVFYRGLAHIGMMKFGGGWMYLKYEIQQFGAYLVWFISLLYVARRYLAQSARDAWRMATLRSADVKQANREPAIAMLAIALGTTGCCLWLRHFGMGEFWPMIYMSLLTVQFVVLARVVAEGGAMFVLIGWFPSTILVMFFAPRVIRPEYLGAALLATAFFARDLREPITPFAMNSLRVMTSSRHYRAGRTGILMMITLVFGMCVAAPVTLGIFYYYGAGRIIDWGVAGEAWGQFWMLASAIREPFRPGVLWGNLGVGAGITAALSALRLRFSWWPLHPIGMLLFNSYAMEQTVFSVFLGWALKVSVMRYGGNRTYQKLRPFFIGAVLGECLTCGFWMVVTVVIYFMGGSPKAINVMPW
ncbi:MAG TPA: hypothetical protein PL033_07370 [Candidatus Brocadiia bacterium]|nr:hypothetical protein [Candidatus Brocadiia bacterium]